MPSAFLDFDPENGATRKLRKRGGGGGGGGGGGSDCSNTQKGRHSASVPGIIASDVGRSKILTGRNDKVTSVIYHPEEDADVSLTTSASYNLKDCFVALGPRVSDVDFEVHSEEPIAPTVSTVSGGHGIIPSSIAGSSQIESHVSDDADVSLTTSASYMLKECFVALGPRVSDVDFEVPSEEPTDISIIGEFTPAFDSAYHRGFPIRIPSAKLIMENSGVDHEHPIILDGPNTEGEIAPSCGHI